MKWPEKCTNSNFVQNFNPSSPEHNQMLGWNDCLESCRRLNEGEVGLDLFEAIKEQKHLIAVENIAGNIVKEAMHKGILAGLTIAESKLGTPPRPVVNPNEIKEIIKKVLKASCTCNDGRGIICIGCFYKDMLSQAIADYLNGKVEINQSR